MESKLESRVNTMNAKGRFAALLSTEASGREDFDSPLLQTKDWIVAPTLGAIIPNWLIIIPRRPSLNFYSWQQQTGSNPTTIISAVGKHLSLSQSKIFWFEHGPRLTGTDVGCGVDYAHIHLILDPIFSFRDLMRQVKASSTLNWSRSSPEMVYRDLSGTDSYLLVGNGDHVYLAENVEQTGSQFMRRMVALTVGQSDNWNYRAYPHYENISQTIKNFRALENAARAGD